MINRLIKSFLYKFNDLFFYKKTENYKKILVLGGYGYKNVGDEAQLSATLNHLYEKFPDYMVKVLTPDLNYTYTEHNKCLVGEAPRLAFYDQDKWNLYTLSKKIWKIIFLFVSFLVYFNAFLVRAGFPVIFITSRAASLLYEIKTSDLVYYSGGGYLTGKTLSRLWDGTFFIRMADVFKVPVVLSGQTIGVWNGNFNKKLAEWGLSKAGVITARDPEDSIQALSEIGISGDNTFVTFDDALFCEKLNNREELNIILFDSGIAPEKDYIALNIHYWKINNSKEKEILINKINILVENILSKTEFNIVLIPMHPTDEEAMNDLINNDNSDRLHLLKYDYDFRVIRAVIGAAKICVTMKHHPIIFAVGEKIPVISLALGEYYEHKNIGALKIFGLDKYNASLDKENFMDDFNILFDDILQNSENIISKLDESFIELKAKKERFLNLTKSLLT